MSTPKAKINRKKKNICFVIKPDELELLDKFKQKCKDESRSMAGTFKWLMKEYIRGKIPFDD